MHSSVKIIGAGLAGATIAQRLAEGGVKNIEVFDSRNHVGGNVHTERDPSTGVMVHKYGPHIFHTDNTMVWRYVNRFGRFWPYTQRTKARARGEVFSFPINLHTINQLYRQNFSPDQAREFIGKRAAQDSRYLLGQPRSFEQLAVSLLGEELYAMFLRDYTKKQWGRDPHELPASILKRLPMRWDYNDNAYDHRYQGIPVEGYTKMVENMLDHPSIKVHLGTHIVRTDWRYLAEDAFVFYSGAIDAWFDYVSGPLAYRTLDLETLVDLSTRDYQGCSVLNSCDLSTPWTRSTEHRHFTPWETSHTGTVVTREFSRECDPQSGDIRYYPVHLAHENERLAVYHELAAREDSVAFVGRLGTYQYLDMDKTIWLSMKRAAEFLQSGR
jgi:UDP-galactopyranose mutase